MSPEERARYEQQLRALTENIGTWGGYSMPKPTGSTMKDFLLQALTLAPMGVAPRAAPNPVIEGGLNVKPIDMFTNSIQPAKHGGNYKNSFVGLPPDEAVNTNTPRVNFNQYHLSDVLKTVMDAHRDFGSIKTPRQIYLEMLEKPTAVDSFINATENYANKNLNPN